jgi:hypothetical protein
LKTQFDHILLSSFYLWFEAELSSSRSKAYSTGLSNEFKNIQGAKIPSTHNCYQGAYRQLVAENSVDEPNSGVFINGGFTSFGNSGIFVDFNNGRLLIPKASGSSLAITGVSTVKEINTYVSNDDDEHLILHGDFREVGQTKPYWFSKEDKLDEKTYFLPACFISLASADNKPFCFGGEEDTKTRVRVTVLTSDNYLLDAVLSYFRDTARKCVTHIDYEDYPYGKFNSLKTYPYSYAALAAAQTDFSKKSTIENVIASKVVNTDLRKNIGKSFSIGFLDFDLSTHRFPRV